MSFVDILKEDPNNEEALLELYDNFFGNGGLTAGLIFENRMKGYDYTEAVYWSMREMYGLDLSIESFNKMILLMREREGITD